MRSTLHWFETDMLRLVDGCRISHMDSSPDAHGHAVCYPTSTATHARAGNVLARTGTPCIPPHPIAPEDRIHRIVDSTARTAAIAGATLKANGAAFPRATRWTRATEAGEGRCHRGLLILSGRDRARSQVADRADGGCRGCSATIGQSRIARMNCDPGATMRSLVCGRLVYKSRGGQNGNPGLRRSTMRSDR